jgi:hypothetical protein
VRSSDEIIEAARDEGDGGEVVGRQMGDGMDQDLCWVLVSALARQRAASPLSSRAVLTVWQLRNRRALIVGPPIALDDLKQGPLCRLLGRLHARILVLADSVPWRRSGSLAAAQSESVQRVLVGAGGARACRIALVATLWRLRHPPQLT